LSEAANREINCSAPARKLKLDKLLESEERGENFQKFSCRAHQYFSGGLKKGKYLQTFSCRTHVIFARKPKKKKIRSNFTKIFL